MAVTGGGQERDARLRAAQSSTRRPSWTQPICDPCWISRHPARPSTRLLSPDAETCAFCGRQTTSGIYVRVDPKTVPFPATREA